MDTELGKCIKARQAYSFKYVYPTISQYKTQKSITIFPYRLDYYIYTIY